jgi:hypothetical protein
MQAVEVAKMTKFHAILLVWEDCNEATQLIHQFDPLVPIIVVSPSFSANEEREQAIARGAADLVGRPLSINKIKQVLQKHALKRCVLSLVDLCVRKVGCFCWLLIGLRFHRYSGCSQLGEICGKLALVTIGPG